MGELFTNTPSTAQGVDSTTQMATHAEQQISRGLAVAMVVVWTAIGALVGTVLPPLLGGLGLLSMALFGLWAWENAGFNGHDAFPRPDMGHHLDEVALRACTGCVALGVA